MLTQEGAHGRYWAGGRTGVCHRSCPGAVALAALLVGPISQFQVLGDLPAAAPLSTPAGLEPALGQPGVCTGKVLHTWRQDSCRFPLLWAQLEWCVGKGCRNPSAALAAAVGVVLALTQPSARACCRPSQSPFPCAHGALGQGAPVPPSGGSFLRQRLLFPPTRGARQPLLEEVPSLPLTAYFQ